jgi:hypothetical protein
VKEGEKPKRRKTHIFAERKWKVFVDKPLPVNIVVSALRPDLTLLDEVHNRVVLGELTVPWEDGIAEAHERKLLRYEELVAEIRERGFSCQLVAFEVGCRGFTAASLKKFLNVAGVPRTRKTVGACGERAVEGSAWILRKFMNVKL